MSLRVAQRTHRARYRDVPGNPSLSAKQNTRLLAGFCLLKRLGESPLMRSMPYLPQPQPTTISTHRQRILKPVLEVQPNSGVIRSKPRWMAPIAPGE